MALVLECTILFCIYLPKTYHNIHKEIRVMTQLYAYHLHFVTRKKCIFLISLRFLLLVTNWFDPNPPGLLQGPQFSHRQWNHPNHEPHDCLLGRLFRRRKMKTSKLRVTGLCEGNSSVTGEFSAQRASSAENISVWWRHHVQIIVPNSAPLLISNILRDSCLRFESYKLHV